MNGCSDGPSRLDLLVGSSKGKQTESENQDGDDRLVRIDAVGGGKGWLSPGDKGEHNRSQAEQSLHASPLISKLARDCLSIKLDALSSRLAID
jgi:hypothetical protein